VQREREVLQSPRAVLFLRGRYWTVRMLQWSLAVAKLPDLRKDLVEVAAAHGQPLDEAIHHAFGFGFAGVQLGVQERRDYQPERSQDGEREPSSLAAAGAVEHRAQR
jgi:hypothetical protein